jgi:site-specific DNA recombinase
MNPKTLPRAGDRPVPRAVIYLRVSTPRQADTAADVVDDGNSIDTQRKDALTKVRQLGAVLAEDGIYIDPGTSAQSIAKRPQFQAMLKRITEQRDVDYVVVYMRSRAFRNALEAMMTKYELKQIGVKLVSAKEDFGEGIYADAMEALSDVFNELEVKRNGEDIKRKMANKVMNGGTPSSAKLGYLNITINSEGRKINTIAVDGERKPLIIAAFELFATGQHTLESLLAKVHAMGLKSRPTKKHPNGHPITLETLRSMLRDRYYIGWVLYKGVEYQGRHETFISPELFNRVQRVLDAHSGAGTRERTHPHYLKGWLWCHRCGKRFIVQRAVGRHGGEYYYFFCKGRQDGICDHPYVPIEKMEAAIEAYYRARIHLPEAFRAEIRAMVDEAVDEQFSLTGDMRDQYAKRLEALDKKESYFLDLAAEEGWPKDKLRERIGAIRAERSDIQANLTEAQQQLDVGRSIFYQALELLDNPAELYARAEDNEVVRATLNKAFFARFMIDGHKVVKGELKEPFDALIGAAERDEVRVYLREVASLPRRAGGTRGGQGRNTPRQLATCPTRLTADGARTDLSFTDSLALATLERARGSSKAVMVGTAGFEPATPRL